jgi:hypothetical protein
MPRNCSIDKVPEPPLAAIDLSEIRFAKTLAALHYLAFAILMLANLARQLAQS